MTKVTLINFGEGQRVFYIASGKTISVEVGGVVDAEMTDTQARRVKLDETMVCLPPDVVERNPSGLMRHLLDTLRNWGGISQEERQAACDTILGVGALGLRPSAGEMRYNLARRAKEAAFYVQQGANEAADNLLGGNLPSVEQQRAAIEAARPKKDDRNIVKGDEDDSESGTVTGDNGTSGASNRQSDAKLVPSKDGPGLAIASGQQRDGDRQVPTAPARPQRQVRRRPEPTPQPARVARKLNPPRKQ